MNPSLPAVSPHSPPPAIEGELALLTDTRRPMQIGLWTLGICFGGFLLWAALAPLDEGVPTQGAVTIDTKRKPVQHLTGGILREVLVGEGDRVEVGQIVARLDPADSRADFESVHQRHMGLLAMESRLLAEQSGAARIDFPDALRSATDPAIRAQVDTQRSLFQSRRSALSAELRALDESRRGIEAMTDSYRAQIGMNEAQRRLVNEQLAGIRDLVAEAYAPRSRQIELERQEAQLQSASAELTGNLRRAERNLGELQQRTSQIQYTYRKEAETQLAQIRLERQANQERLGALSDDLSRTELRAPVAGQVVGLTVQSPGAVIQPAQRLMDIVPEDEALLLETRVPPHLIDRVEQGSLVDIRFSTFAHAPQLVAEGRVLSVSGDLIVENTPMGPLSFYLARIEVTPQGLKTLGDRRLHAGMPAEVIIKTGERSLFTYLMYPLTKRIATSMKEE